MVRCVQTWRVLRGRHTRDQLAQIQTTRYKKAFLYATVQMLSLADQVLANLTCNALATWPLIPKSSLPTWIQRQTHGPSYKEDMAGRRSWRI